MSTVTAPSTPTSALRIAAGLAAAAVVAALVNAMIGTLGALVAGAAPTGLALPAPVLASVAGVLVGAAGWALVRRFAARPAAALRVVVPVAVVVTWIPDLLLLAGGATVANALVLMAMHVVVAVSVVPVLARVLPVA